MKKIFIIIGLLIALIVGYLFARKYNFKIEDKAKTPTTTLSPAPSSATAVSKLGDGVDEYGCKVSSGYSWCKTKNKCIREWEETCDEQEAIAQALADKNGWSANDIVVTVTKIDGNYARGMVNGKSEPGGGIYWAAKTDGKWKIVQDGNGIPDCNVLKVEYKFPPDFLTGVCD